MREPGVGTVLDMAGEDDQTEAMYVVEQNDTTETTMSPENMSDKYIAYHNAIDFWNQLITTKILLSFFYKYLHSGIKTVEPTQFETLLTPSDY